MESRFTEKEQVTMATNQHTGHFTYLQSLYKIKVSDIYQFLLSSITIIIIKNKEKIFIYETRLFWSVFLSTIYSQEQGKKHDH